MWAFLWQCHRLHKAPERHVEHCLRTCSACVCCAGAVALTTNQNYVRDFTVAYDILYENISDQVAHMLVLLSACV